MINLQSQLFELESRFSLFSCIYNTKAQDIPQNEKGLLSSLIDSNFYGKCTDRINTIFTNLTTVADPEQRNEFIRLNTDWRIFSTNSNPSISDNRVTDNLITQAIKIHEQIQNLNVKIKKKTPEPTTLESEDFSQLLCDKEFLTFIENTLSKESAQFKNRFSHFHKFAKELIFAILKGHYTEKTRDLLLVNDVSIVTQEPFLTFLLCHNIRQGCPENLETIERYINRLNYEEKEIFSFKMNILQLAIEKLSIDEILLLVFERDKSNFSEIEYLNEFLSHARLQNEEYTILLRNLSGYYVPSDERVVQAAFHAYYHKFPSLGEIFSLISDSNLKEATTQFLSLLKSDFLPKDSEKIAALVRRIPSVLLEHIISIMTIFGDITKAIQLIPFLSDEQRKKKCIERIVTSGLTSCSTVEKMQLLMTDLPKDLYEFSLKIMCIFCARDNIDDALTLAEQIINPFIQEECYPLIVENIFVYQSLDQALECVEGLKPYLQAVSYKRIASLLASSDPIKAFEVGTRIPIESVLLDCYECILSRVPTTTNLQDFIATLVDKKHQETCYKILIRQKSDQNLCDAFEMTTHIHDLDFLREYYEKFFSQIAKDTLFLAYTLSARVQDDLRNTCYEFIYYSLLDQEKFDDALTCISFIENNEIRGKLYAICFETVSNINLEEALQSIELIPIQFRDFGLRGIALALCDRDPQKSKEVLYSIKDKNVFLDTKHTIIGIAVDIEASGVEEYVRTLEPAAQDDAFFQFAIDFIKRDPKKAIQIAKYLQDDERKKQCIVEIMRIVAASSHEEALQLISLIEDTYKLAAYYEIAYQMVFVDHQVSIQLLNAIESYPEGENIEEEYINVIVTIEDDQDAFHALNGIPEKYQNICKIELSKKFFRENQPLAFEVAKTISDLNLQTGLYVTLFKDLVLFDSSKAFDLLKTLDSSLWPAVYMHVFPNKTNPYFSQTLTKVAQDVWRD